MSLTTGVLGAKGVSNHTKIIIRLFPFFLAQMHKVFAKSFRDILEDIYHKIRRYCDSQKRENSGFQARRPDQSATLPPLTNRLK